MPARAPPSISRFRPGPLPPPRRRPGRVPQPQLAGKRLLVIEDNATNRRIITQRGQQWGMTVETAANSRDALARLAQGDLFDAVILDLELPDKDGLALAEDIRALPAGASRRPLFAAFHPCACAVTTSARSQGGHLRVCPQTRPPRAILDALYRALSIQLQREKRAPVTPVLDSGFAARSSRCACCWPMTTPSIKRWA